MAICPHASGRTWQQQFAKPDKSYFRDGARWVINDVYFKNNETGWAVGDAGIIFRTEDGGETWVLTAGKRLDYQQLGFLDSEFGWVTYKYGNGPWGVAITKDNGRRWISADESFIRDVSSVHAVFVTPRHGFAVNVKLYETKDGGHHWQRRDDVGQAAYSYLGRASDGTLVALG